MDIKVVTQGLRELGDKADRRSLVTLLREASAAHDRQEANVLDNIRVQLGRDEVDSWNALLYAAHVLRENAEKMEKLALAEQPQPFIFLHISHAPQDGTEVLARWSNTEHGHRYAVVHYVARDEEWYDGDIPVRNMDAFCYLPKE